MKSILTFCLALCFVFSKSQTNFVLLDAQKTAVNVVVVDSLKSLTESDGIDYLRGMFGPSTVWKQCYYSGTKPNFPLVGVSTYDISINCFIDPRPTGSYTYNINQCRWDTLR